MCKVKPEHMQKHAGKEWPDQANGIWARSIFPTSSNDSVTVTRRQCSTNSSYCSPGTFWREVDRFSADLMGLKWLNKVKLTFWVHEWKPEVERLKRVCLKPICDNKCSNCWDPSSSGRGLSWTYNEPTMETTRYPILCWKGWATIKTTTTKKRGSIGNFASGCDSV